MRTETGIRNIERNLSLKRIKNQRKYSAMILCIAVLACLLMQIGFQMTAGIQETFGEARKEIYGEWGRILLETDPKSERLVNENPFIEKKGSIQIYGVLEGDYWETKQSNIGSMDETAWELGRFKLREGRLPQSEDEIAMEYSMLAALGYEERLGEEIRLRIVPSTAFSHEEETKELVYTLCGIIKDYQVNWEISSRHRLPTGLVTREGGERIGNVLEKHMLIRSRKGEESVYEELAANDAVSCQVEENSNKGVLATDNIPFERFFDNIRLFIAGAAVCILFLAISRSIDAREDFWSFLHALGMEKRQMYRMIGWEAGLYCLISTVLGTVGGLIGYKGILPVFEKIMGKSMVEQLSRRAAINGVLCSILIMGVSYFFSGVRLNRILRKEEGKKQTNVKKRRAYPVSRFTPLSVVMHRWRYAGRRKALQILLLASALVMAGIGVMEAKSKDDDLNMYRHMTGNGYFLSTETIPNLSGIRTKAIRSLEQIAGVESVETYRTSGKETFTIDLSGHSDSKYFKEVVKTEQAYREDASINQVSLSVLGVNQWENLERFTRNLSEGTISQNDFESGDFCILCLPPLEKIDLDVDGNGPKQMYMDNAVEEEFQESFLTENEIKVGDFLNITRWEDESKLQEEGEQIQEITERTPMTTERIRVDGILRTSKWEDIRSPYPGGAGIHIIAGAGFWEKFLIHDAGESCPYVRVNVSDEAEVFDTEEHILREVKTMGAVDFTNYHQGYEQERQNLYSFVGTYSIVAVFYLILISIVLYQMLEAEAHERKRDIQTFRALGMEEGFLVKMKRMERILMGVLAVTGSAAILAVYYLIMSR